MIQRAKCSRRIAKSDGLDLAIQTERVAHLIFWKSLILLLLTLFIAPPTFAAETIKLATLAPKTSSWMKIFSKMGNEIKTESGGEVKIRFYPDGVQGDELDVIKKMRAGLLHASAVTSVGLGEIQRSVLIFQTPRLFHSYEELDYVRDQLKTQLNQTFEESGYVLLGWGDIGYYYLFSNQPIKSLDDLRNPNVKMWVRVDDPVSVQFFKSAETIGVPLTVTQVLPALYSKQINALVVSPLACVALQWYPKLKYMTDMPLAIGVGATLITKEKFDQLSPDAQQILRETAEKHHQDLIVRVREDNDKSIEALQKKAGLKRVSVGDAEQKRWDSFAGQVQGELAGKIYPKELLEQVNALLGEYRGGK